MARSLPGLLRLIVVVALAAFWLGVAFVAALVAWPEGVVMALGIAGAATLASTLVLIGQVWARARAADGDRRSRRRHVLRPVELRRLDDVRPGGGVGR
jgi:hypothetical protein